MNKSRKRNQLSHSNVADIILWIGEHKEELTASQITVEGLAERLTAHFRESLNTGDSVIVTKHNIAGLQPKIERILGHPLPTATRARLVRRAREARPNGRKSKTSQASALEHLDVRTDVASNRRAIEHLYSVFNEPLPPRDCNGRKDLRRCMIRTAQGSGPEETQSLDEAKAMVLEKIKELS